MSGIADFQNYEDDFIGTSATFPTTADPATPWLVDITGAAPPTHVRNASAAILSLEATSQVQILGLHHGDALSFDIDDIQRVEMRVKIGGAFTTGSTLVFGVCSARNDDAAAIAEFAFFRMTGATSTTVVYAESDDGTTDVAPTSTGVTLATVYKRFVIDFTGGKSNVKFYINGQRVCPATTFNMSAYTGSLQPLIQLQKAANTNADVCTVDYVKIACKR